MNESAYNFNSVHNYYHDCLNSGSQEEAILVGWGSHQNQYSMFGNLFNNLELEGKSILDIGCGVGSLVDFLTKRKIKNFDYFGIDIVPAMIEKAKINYPGYQFECRDILKDKLDRKFDYVVLSGIFSIKVNNHEQFWRDFMQLSFQVCNIAVLANFCSSYILGNEISVQIAREFIFESPPAVLQYCLSLSKHVELIHGSSGSLFSVQLFKIRALDDLETPEAESEIQTKFADIISEIEQGKLDGAYNDFKDLINNSSIDQKQGKSNDAFVSIVLHIFINKMLLLQHKSYYLKFIDLLIREDLKKAFSGILFFVEQNYVEAINCLSIAVEANDNFVNVRSFYAVALELAGDIDTSKMHYEKILESGKLDYGILARYCNILLQEKRFNQVQKILLNYPNNKFTEQIKTQLAQLKSLPLK